MFSEVWVQTDSLGAFPVQLGALPCWSNCMCSINLDFCNISFHSLRIISRNLSHLFGIHNLVPDLTKAKKKEKKKAICQMCMWFLAYIYNISK